MKSVLLTFDVEEFDLPLEYGQSISQSRQLEIGKAGLDEVVGLLAPYDIPLTLYTTAFFATQYPENIAELAQTHEIASHAYHHSQFNPEDYARSKQSLEAICGQPVSGFRMPRLAPIDYQLLATAGYAYDSSLNPTWLPGRYNQLKAPKTVHKQGSLTIVPASVSPFFRIPLFWLSFKHFPLPFYLHLLRRSLDVYGYVNLYLHPWEFTDISMFKLPFYLQKSPKMMQQKLKSLVEALQQSEDIMFVKTQDFVAKFR